MEDIDHFIDRHYNLTDCTADNKTRNQLKTVLMEYAKLYHNHLVAGLDKFDIDASELSMEDQARLRMLFSTGKVKIKCVIN